MYLELVYNNHSEEAKQLLEKFGGNLEEYYQNDLKRLSNVTKREQMAGNELTDTFKYAFINSDDCNMQRWLFMM